MSRLIFFFFFFFHFTFSTILYLWLLGNQCIHLLVFDISLSLLFSFVFKILYIFFFIIWENLLLCTMSPSFMRHNLDDDHRLFGGLLPFGKMNSEFSKSIYFNHFDILCVSLERLIFSHEFFTCIQCLLVATLHVRSIDIDNVHPPKWKCQRKRDSKTRTAKYIYTIFP